MKIKREIGGVEISITLTSDEIGQAYKEFITSWMKAEIIQNIRCDETKAETLAEIAYVLYCEGDGLTEYEAVQDAIEKHS